MIISHYLELVWQYRRLVAMIALGIFLAATGVGVVQLLMTPVYIATASVTVLPTQAELSYSRRFVSDGDGGSDPAAVMMQTHIENLFSRPVAELTLKRLLNDGEDDADEAAAEPDDNPLKRMVKQALSTLKTFYQIANTGTAAQPSAYDKAIAGIQKSISVDWVQGSYILRISAEADTPKRAARIANSVSQAYVERNRRVADEAAAAVRQYLEQELAKHQTRLDPDGVNDLRRRLVDAELSRTAGLGQVRIIDPAVEPLRPSMSVVPISVGGGATGVLMGLLVVIAIDTFGSAARTSMDMSRVVGSRFIGRVPAGLALRARQQLGKAKLPLSPVSRFATAITGRISLAGNPSGQIWVHVIGVGGECTARQGGIAIGAAFAASDIPTTVILGPGERFRVRCTANGLLVQRLEPDEPLGSGPIVTAGPLVARRPPLLADARTSRSEPLDEPSQANEASHGGIVPRPLVVVAAAAGQVSEDLLAAMAREGGPPERFFVLVP